MSSEYGNASKETKEQPEEKGVEETKAEECYRYEGDLCIYTEPNSRKEYVLNKDKTDWVPRDGANYEFDGKTYIHRDDKTGRKRRWNLDSKEWETSESEMDSDTEDSEKPKIKKGMPGWNPSANISKDSESGTQTYTDPSDGTLYEWDASKKAWFPKIDTDFMAVYQLNYGFTSDGKAQPSVPTPSPALTVVNNPEPGANNKTKAKQQQANSQSKKPEWFQVEAAKNTKVYVSGLPESISEEKFISMMSRFGVIETDVRNENKPKIKLYRDSNGIPKGDALCSFVMVESVDLAIQILDDSLYEDGRSRISVERARFQMKGEAYKPELKPKKLRKKELDKLRKTKDKKLAWDFDVPRGLESRPKCHKVLVISNLFTPLDFNEEPEKIFEVKGKVKSACEKFGSIRKVEIFDQHPEGVGLVFFRDFEETDVAIDMLNGRLLNGRAIKTVHWDGKTKYENKETQEEEMKRLHVWNKFLEEEENNKEDSID